LCVSTEADVTLLLRHTSFCRNLQLQQVSNSAALLLMAFQVVIQYKSAGRLLQSAQRLWAHAGHSGWQHTLDVELFRSPQDSTKWTGIYK